MTVDKPAKRAAARALSLDTEARSCAALLLLLGARHALRDAALVLRGHRHHATITDLVAAVDRVCADLAPAPEPTCLRCMQPVSDACPMASGSTPEMICPVHGVAGHLWDGDDVAARAQVRRVGPGELLRGCEARLRAELAAALGLR